jgi:nucleotide-binding universal stress UspA family protein
MKRFANVLFVAEPDVANAAALDRAIALAENNQAQLTFAGTVDIGNTVLPQRFRDALILEREEQVREMVRGRTLAGRQIDSKILIGKPFIEVIREVLLNERDIVVKPHENATGLRLAGGTDSRLLRKCPCPVWIINSADVQGYQQILVALDFEPDNPENEPLNRQLVDMAASVALSEFAELHLVHAWRLEHEGVLRSPRSGLSRTDVDQMVQQEEDRRRRWLTGLVEDWAAPQGEEVANYLRPQFHLIRGHAQDVVPRCARDLGAELVVMGTVGRTGISGLVIGNTAEKILNNIECSVLAVKPAGFVSPVTAADRS